MKIFNNLTIIKLDITDNTNLAEIKKLLNIYKLIYLMAIMIINSYKILENLIILYVLG